MILLLGFMICLEFLILNRPNFSNIFLKKLSGRVNISLQLVEGGGGMILKGRERENASDI